MDGVMQEQNTAYRLSRYHRVNLGFITQMDHRGNPSYLIAYCKKCKETVVKMMDGKYHHVD